jgi:hypothetical protein
VPVLDGLMATSLDEAALRGDPTLAPYWRSRHGLRGDCAALIAADRPLLEVRNPFDPLQTPENVSVVFFNDTFPLLPSSPLQRCHKVLRLSGI